MAFPWKKILTFGVSALVEGLKRDKESAAGLATAGTLLSMLVNSIEAAKGKGNGPAKEDAVLAAFVATLAVAEGLSETDLLDDEKFVAAVRSAIKAIVAANNAVKDLKALQPAA